MESNSPELTESPATLDLGLESESMIFTVTNSGNAVLDWQAASLPEQTWITSCSPSTGSLDADETQQISVTVDRNVVADGDYQGTIEVSSNGGAATVEVKMVVTQLSFTDITLSAGTGGPSGVGETGGHSATFADVDGDGRPDLYTTMLFEGTIADLYFHNLGNNNFENQASARGIADVDGGSHGACFADLDNDGDFDLVNGRPMARRGAFIGNNIYQMMAAGILQM